MRAAPLDQHNVTLVHTRQPARELATIEVVPMGARGELSWRPQVTDWLFKDIGELVKRPTGTRSRRSPWHSNMAMIGY